MPRFALTVLAVALVVLPIAARAASPAQDVEAPAFVAALDELAARVRGAASADEIVAVGRDLPEAWTVRVGADRVAVEAASVADTLASATAETWPEAQARAVARIEALREEAAPLARGGTPPPAHLRAALTEVLAAPEFRGRQRYAGLLAFVDRVKRWVRSWLPNLDGAGESVTPILRYASWGVAILAFLLLAWLTWRLLRGVWRDAAVRQAAVRGRAPLDARAWAAGAAAAVAAGDAREAVRCAYHAAIHRLDEDGAWTIAEDRTPREYLHLLPPTDRRQPAVAFVARLFEGAWFGGAEPALDEARAAVGHLTELGCHVQADPAI